MQNTKPYGKSAHASNLDELRFRHSSTPCFSLTCKTKLEFFLDVKSQYVHLNIDCCLGDPIFLAILYKPCIAVIASFHLGICAKGLGQLPQHVTRPSSFGPSKIFSLYSVIASSLRNPCIRYHDQRTSRCIFHICRLSWHNSAPVM